jgi:hypothetical protein
MLILLSKKLANKQSTELQAQPIANSMSKCSMASQGFAALSVMYRRNVGKAPYATMNSERSKHRMLARCADRALIRQIWQA